MLRAALLLVLLYLSTATVVTHVAPPADGVGRTAARLCAVSDDSPVPESTDMQWTVPVTVTSTPGTATSQAPSATVHVHRCGTAPYAARAPGKPSSAAAIQPHVLHIPLLI